MPLLMLNSINQSMIDSYGGSRQIRIPLIQIIRDFDQEIIELGDVNIKKVTDTFSDILFWLYLVLKGKINTVPTIGCSVKEVRIGHSNIV